MTPDNPSIEETDAMLTDAPGLYLMALSADCPPVFFYDPREAWSDWPIQDGRAQWGASRGTWSRLWWMISAAMCAI